MTPTVTTTKSWILAEFETVDGLLQAGRAMREKGLADLDTYSPYPLHGVDEALGWAPSRVPFIALGGAVTGGLLGFSMQYYLNAVEYPINVANRLLASIPAFMPITFELTVLLTGVIMFLGLMALMGLPRLHHPVFEAEGFESASTHAFWLSVAVPSSEKDTEIMESLKALGGRQVSVVREEV
jgi:hypothetical protein